MGTPPFNKKREMERTDKCFRVGYLVMRKGVTSKESYILKAPSRERAVRMVEERLKSIPMIEGFTMLGAKRWREYER